MAPKHRPRGQAGKSRKAATVARAVAATPRPFGEAELQRGLTAFNQGNYAAAISIWQAGQRNAGAPPALGAALAEAYFRRALERSTGPARPADTTASQDGHPHSSRSIQDLQQALALAPRHATYHFHLALAEHRAGHLDRALAAYEAAYQLAPRDGRIRRHMTLALLSFEHDPAAVNRTRELLATAPAREESAQRLRALAYLRDNDAPAALLALEGQANTRPANQGDHRTPAASRDRRRTRPSPYITLARGLVQLAAGQREAAQASLQPIIESQVHPRMPQVARADPNRSEELASSALAGAAVLGVMAARLGSGDLDGAFAALQMAVMPMAPTLQPAFVSVCHRLVLALALDERAADAALALERALAAEPGRPETLRCLTHLHELAGVQAARRGDYHAAAQHWQAALAHAGETVRPRLVRNLALAEERREHWQQASTRWEELIRQWRKELQELRQRRERRAKAPASGEAQAASPAAAAYHAPEELRRWLAVAYRHQAGALEAAGDQRGAIRTLERALNFDPANLVLRRRIAESYLDNEQYGPAIEQLQQLHAANPTDTNVLLELGSALDLNGDERQAQQYLEQALALEPENQAAKDTLASVHHGHALRLAASGANERALAEYLQAVELAPHQANHHLGLGTHYLKMGQLGAAQGAFARAMDLTPRDGFTRLVIGLAYLSVGHPKPAEQFFRQAQRLDRSLRMQALVGIAYFRSTDPSKAEPYFSRVLKGRDAIALTSIGQTLTDAKQWDAALPYLERAVEVSPLNPEARMALAYARAFGQADHVRAAAELEAAQLAAELLNDRELLAEIATARGVNAMLGDIRSGARP